MIIMIIIEYFGTNYWYRIDVVKIYYVSFRNLNTYTYFYNVFVNRILTNLQKIWWYCTKL